MATLGKDFGTTPMSAEPANRELGGLPPATKSFRMKLDKLRDKRGVGSEDFSGLKSATDELIKSGILSNDELGEARRFLRTVTTPR